MSGGGPGGNMFGGGGGGGKLDRSISPLGEPPPLEMLLTLLNGVFNPRLSPLGVEFPGEEPESPVEPPIVGDSGDVGGAGRLV